MAVMVNTNASSLNAQRQLSNSGNALDTSFKRLSSGFRINSAADDAAGLQISNRLTSQINGLNQAVRNANDGISLSQTAEGALDETTNMLQRMRTLSIQASNDSNNDQDRLALQQEADQLRLEINRVAEQTSFGGQNLLDGSYSARFQVGAEGGQTISFSMSTITTNTGGSIAINANGGFTMSGIAGAASAVTGLAGVGSTVSTTSLSLTSIANAQDLISTIDAMISVVDAKRSELGAIQNRFSSTIRNLSNISENVSAARSRVRDTDFAVETAELTRNQILQQASTSILSQANQRPQTALSLLG
ncbi:flagellin [Marinomonas algicola]|uniref:flagellin N-terminal helical domain-containing protein n=1 Tax=Marinomonas algicola TaxID=2773454 RepID=UPI00174D4862|nr:flagellin [Marinomonas algicola]